MSCLFLLLPYMAEALLKDKARDRACCKEIPQQRHREVLDEGADKDGRKLHDRHAAEDDIEEDGCHKAHGRAHDKDRAGGMDDRAQEGIVALGVHKPGDKICAHTRFPEVREQEDEEPHVGSLDKSAKNTSFVMFENPPGMVGMPIFQATL